ncbi:MAG: AAA family ATPase [Chitinophagales bacterium]|nr:AAA family ATPase [Chitinophagales bacterium]
MNDIDIQHIVESFINHTNTPVFLTGKAGTGKTTLLRKIIQTTHKACLVVAPTGIAALNAGGVTIHSQFQLPFATFLPSDDFPDFSISDVQIENKTTLKRHLRMHHTKRQVIQQAELLIIDEVSMLRADVLDAIDTVLQFVRKNNQLFGGIQLLLIGDMLQLPPIVRPNEWEILKHYYSDMFFFNALSLKENKPIYIELEKVYRQADESFINILNNIRNNNINDKDIEILNNKYQPNFKPKPNESVITLTTHNRIADGINANSLQQIKKEVFTYQAEIEGDFPNYIFPVEEQLQLKVGAQIMFIRNDASEDKQFYNGKLAKVIELSDNEIVVDLENGTTLSVEKHEWYNKKYSIDSNTKNINEEVLGTFVQYPIKLAWAITVHKSQGLSFDNAIIDVQNVFAAGQAYVALSRLRSLEGLILKTPFKSNHLQYHNAIQSFAKQKQSVATLPNIVEQQSYSYLNSLIAKAFDFTVIEDIFYQHILSYNKKEGTSIKQQYQDWALKQYHIVASWKTHGDKFIQQVNILFNSNSINVKYINERVHAAQQYFTVQIEQVLKEILETIQTLNTIKRTKTFAAELNELDDALYFQYQNIYKSTAFIKFFQEKQILNKQNWEQYFGDDKRKQLLPTPKENVPIKKLSTVDITFQLYQEGKNIDEIAKERKLTTGTITTHFAKLIARADVKITDIMEEARVNELQHIMENHRGSTSSAIKEIVDNHFSFDEIKLVRAYIEMLERN